ncbi:MAG: hypothetical protein RIT45_421 [Pseudomonadota bacterium]
MALPLAAQAGFEVQALRGGAALPGALLFALGGELVLQLVDAAPQGGEAAREDRGGVVVGRRFGDRDGGRRDAPAREGREHRGADQREQQGASHQLRSEVVQPAVQSSAGSTAPR